MTAIEDAHARAAERSRWKPVRAAWAAIHATAWNDCIEPGRDRDITKPQWALAYAQRLKQFAETACAAGLVSRINLMQNPAGILFSPELRTMVFSNLPQFWKEESGAALGERVAWELVKMALTEEANLLAETIENLPDECEWKTTFENELPRVFVTGVIEPKIRATTPSNNYVANLRSKAVSKIESEVSDDMNAAKAAFLEQGGTAAADNGSTRASSGFVGSQPAGQTKVQPVDNRERAITKNRDDKRLTTNEKMVVEFTRDRSCIEWTAQQWAELLQVDSSTVRKTPTWRIAIAKERDRSKSERRNRPNAKGRKVNHKRA